jgi:hypothetical protein
LIAPPHPLALAIAQAHHRSGLHQRQFPAAPRS